MAVGEIPEGVQQAAAAVWEDHSVPHRQPASRPIRTRATGSLRHKPHTPLTSQQVPPAQQPHGQRSFFALQQPAACVCHTATQRKTQPSSSSGAQRGRVGG